jgi:hypothetical protein
LRGETVCPSAVRTVRERVLGEIGAVEASLGWVLCIERRVFAGVRRRYALAGVAAALVPAVVLGVAWLSGGNSAPGVERITHAGLPEAGDIVLHEPPPGVLVEDPGVAPAVSPARLEEPTRAGRAQPPDAHVYSREVEFPVLGWDDLPLMAASLEPAPASLEVLPQAELPDKEPDPILVKMLTDNPDIVIYWMADQDDPNEGGV